DDKRADGDRGASFTTERDLPVGAGHDRGPGAPQADAGCTDPYGRVPYAFEIRTRSALPPMLTRGIMRSVWLANAAPSAGAGAAVHVPTQCVLSVMVPLYIVRAFFVACAAACSRCTISGMCTRSVYGPMFGRLCMNGSSLPGVGRGLTHRL